MTNLMRHESEFAVDGRIYRLKWDLGAMAEIEAALGLRGPSAIFERLRDIGVSDLIKILAIMSRSGGDEIAAPALKSMPFDAFIPACEAIARAINGPASPDAEKKMTEARPQSTGTS